MERVLLNGQNWMPFETTLAKILAKHKRGNLIWNDVCCVNRYENSDAKTPP